MESRKAGPQRLRKPDILRGYGSFSKVFSTGQSLSTGALRCFYSTQESGHGTVKTGFAVSRNVRSAVQRNRIKRLMRETWRTRQADLQINKTGLYLVFLYGSSGKKDNLRLQAVDAMMQKLIEKLNESLK